MLAVVLLMMPSVKVEAASVSNPKVIVEKVAFNESIISVTLKNMSTTADVTDVLLTYASEKDVVVPMDGLSNQVFIASIKASDSVTVDLPVTVKNAGSTSAKVEFNIEYVVASNDSQKSNQAFIMLDLSTAGGSITVSNVSFPREGYLYEKGLVSLTYKNATDADITDLKLIVSGLNGDNIEVYNIGDVKAKKTGYFETYLSFNTAGTRNVVLAYSYTTSDGEEVISEGTVYSTDVTEKKVEVVNPVADTNDEKVEPIQPRFNMSYVFIGLAGVLVTICIVLVVISFRKKK